MKPTTLFAALLCCTASMAHAQKMTKDAKYRRSSLYTMMIEDRKMTGGAEAIVVNTFSKMPTPDKYDDHCVGARIAEIDDLTISEADLKAAAELTGKGTKKGLGGLMKAAGKQVAAPEEKGKLSDNEYIARLMKYFEQNHTANKMIAKWYGVEDLNQANTYQFGFKLIKERGLQNASKEELDKATLVKGGVDKIVRADSQHVCHGDALFLPTRRRADGANFGLHQRHWGVLRRYWFSCRNGHFAGRLYAKGLFCQDHQLSFSVGLG